MASDDDEDEDGAVLLAMKDLVDDGVANAET